MLVSQSFPVILKDLEPEPTSLHFETIVNLVFIHLIPDFLPPPSTDFKAMDNVGESKHIQT